MHVMTTDKHETEIQLLVNEKKILQKANWLLAGLKKHHGGPEEVAAADAVSLVAAKWAPEPKPKSEEKSDVPN